MNTTGKRLLAIFLIFFGGIALNKTGKAFAQIHELGFAAGVMSYRGEISPQVNPRFIGQSLQGYYRFNFSPAWTFKASLQEGEFNANDLKNHDPLPLARNLTTNTTIVEFGGFIEYNFFDYRSLNARRMFTPYFISGLAFAIYSQEAASNIRTSSGTTFALPLGLGMRFQLSKSHDFLRHLNVNLEVLARKTFTDNLDGIRKHSLTNGQQAGDPYGKDWYYFAGAGLSYTIYGIKCPEHWRQ